MSKITVDLTEHIGTSLIVKWPTGVVYTLQTAGNWCLRPEEEGFLIPVGNDADENDRFITKEDDLIEYFKEPNIVGEGAIHGITEKNADCIDKILKIPPTISNITVDRSLLKKSHEGWLHVIIHKSFAPLYVNRQSLQKGVLIWAT